MRRKYSTGEIVAYFTGKDAWNKGMTMSEEHREKLSKAKLGKKQTTTHIEARSKGREKKVYQFDINGNLIKIWDGTRHIEKETDGLYLAQGVRGVCNGSKLYYLDSIFRYETDIDIDNPHIPDDELKLIQDVKSKSAHRSKRGKYK